MIFLELLWKVRNKTNKALSDLDLATYTQNIELGSGRLLVSGAAADRSPLVTLQRAALMEAPWRRASVVAIAQTRGCVREAAGGERVVFESSSMCNSTVKWRKEWLPPHLSTDGGTRAAEPKGGSTGVAWCAAPGLWGHKIEFVVSICFVSLL